jgi:hypothetical protein
MKRLIKGSWVIALLYTHLFIISVKADITDSQNPGENLIGYWTFDAVTNNRTRDEATGLMDHIEGNYKLVEGVKGNALKCDGFTTTIIRDVEEMPEIRGAFSIEAWVAPQAYPWNWCAIVNQEFEHQRGFFFGIDAEGRIGFHAAVARQWRECISEVKIPFMEWSYVVATFDPESGISLFINGENTGFLEVSGDLLNDFEKDLQIARNHKLTIPASLNRGGFSRVPASYSFDGIIDELKITSGALDPDEIRQNNMRFKPVEKPPLKWRKLPAINTDNPDFGAYYTRLEYDEDWDALWKDDRYPDIVVTFPGEDYSMVFWKGTNYNLNLVTENGKWIGDQSVETFGSMGCMEHMSDKQNRYSHVRIIENHSARVVIHWRYALTDITYQIANINPVTNWGDWVDEYYYIYPDGIAIRHFIIHGVTDEDEYSVTEPTLFSNPGEKPEDNIMLEAVRLANLNGEVSSHSYETWPSGEDGGFKNAVDNAVITSLNLKSEIRPFFIYEPGSGISPYGGGRREIDYRYSKFHSRNHWPVSQVPCDGRFVLAADRVTSSAITSVEPVKSQRESDKARVGRFMMGLSGKPIEQIVPLARFWLHPPAIGTDSKAYDYEGFNRDERAYYFTKENELAGDLSLTVQASSESPLVNPVLVIKNWGKHGLEIEQDGRKLEEGNDYTCSVRRSLDTKDLIIWFNLSTQDDINLNLVPKVRKAF